jgi:GTP-dependent phosphoenolpyruvate carboxykinase
MSLDREAWATEVVDQESLFFKLRARMPKELINERQQLVSRL